MTNLRTQWTYLSVMALAVALLSMGRIIDVTRDLFHPGMDTWRSLAILFGVMILTCLIHALIFKSWVDRFLNAITSASLQMVTTSRLFYGAIVLSYAMAVVSTTVGVYEVVAMMYGFVDTGWSVSAIICPVGGLVLLCTYEYCIRKLVKEKHHGLR